MWAAWWEAVKLTALAPFLTPGSITRRSMKVERLLGADMADGAPNGLPLGERPCSSEGVVAYISEEYQVSEELALSLALRHVADVDAGAAAGRTCRDVARAIMAAEGYG